ncbi:MAG TPA: hypothetical protein VF212_08260 [Longimicrobiales bacterium]
MFASLGLALALAACGDEPTRPAAEPEPEPPRGSTFGLVEVTVSGLGEGAELRASAVSAASLAELRAARAAGRPSGSGAPRPTLTPPLLPGGDGTIQIEPVSTGSFTMGTRGEGGVRYVTATFRVRNAQADSMPYGTPRENLTFLAVATSGTIGGTALSGLWRFDGSPADSAIAAAILPTGAVRLDPATGDVAPAGADVLQVLLEAEVDAIDLTNHPDVVTVFPYGFVVRNPANATSRALPASPAEDQFDGLVTFAFKVPLQETAADDPYTVSFLFLAVDDSEVRITQSLEEQSPEGQAAFEARAAALGASLITVLPGSGYTGEPSRPICSVRTAGTPDAPTGYLVNDCEEGSQTWLGLVDTDWSEPGNWLPAGVPSAFDAVLVSAAANAPTLTAPARIAGLTVSDGMTVALDTFDLTVTGDVRVEADGARVTGTTGRLILEGAAGDSVSGRLPGVTVKGPYTAAGNVAVNGTLWIQSGRIHTAGHRITIAN